MSDYSGRIERLQSLMREQRVEVTVLAGTDQMRYLSGWLEGGHERFVGLLVPAEADPAFVVPAMNVTQARATRLASPRSWDGTMRTDGTAKFGRYSQNGRLAQVPRSWMMRCIVCICSTYSPSFQGCVSRQPAR